MGARVDRWTPPGSWSTPHPSRHGVGVVGKVHLFPHFGNPVERGRGRGRSQGRLTSPRRERTTLRTGSGVENGKGQGDFVITRVGPSAPDRILYRLPPPVERFPKTWEVGQGVETTQNRRRR